MIYYSYAYVCLKNYKRTKLVTVFFKKNFLRSPTNVHTLKSELS